LRKAKIDVSKITFRVCQVLAKINIWVVQTCRISVSVGGKVCKRGKKSKGTAQASLDVRLLGATVHEVERSAYPLCKLETPFALGWGGSC
jgi:hypothetical protein